MRKKQIFVQTQGVDKNRVSPFKPMGFVALNFDNIKMTIDAYDYSGVLAEPREDSLVEIMDEKEVFQFTPAQLLQAIRFFQRYAEMGKDVVRFKNIFHVIMPDRYKNALQVTKRGLKF